MINHINSIAKPIINIFVYNVLLIILDIIFKNKIKISSQLKKPLILKYKKDKIKKNY